MKKALFTISLVATFILISGSSLNAAWTINGTAICTADEHQWTMRSAPDGAGGAIITWTDERYLGEDLRQNIFAQRIDERGNLLWGSGVIVCAEIKSQSHPVICPDGSGGAIIAWGDSRAGASWWNEVYAQRIGSDGNAMWPSGGVALTSPEFTPGDLDIAPDGSGGAIVSYEYTRQAPPPVFWKSDIYAQRVNSGGTVQWAPNGIAITSSDQAWCHKMCSDDAGGAIIAWEEHAGEDCIDIYAKRISGSGSAVWGGRAVCSAAYNQRYIEIASDGSNGAIITWRDFRYGDDSEIYTQRIDASGIDLWASNGLRIHPSGHDNTDQQVIGDGSGGAIIVWDANYLFVRKVTALGILGWQETISPTAGGKEHPQLCSDGQGGAIVTWVDSRSGNKDIYAQRLDAATGDPKWIPYDQAVPVCTAGGYQDNLSIVNIGSRRAIIAWEDTRGSDYDIYAQKVADTPPHVGPACYVQSVLIHDGSEIPLSDSCLFGCPQGDRGFDLKVTCDFEDVVFEGVDTIHTESIVIDTSPDDINFFFCDSHDDDEPGTPENGFVVTLYKRNICGSSGCDGAVTIPDTVTVLYGDFEIGYIRPLSVKSIDVIGFEGAVNSSDLSVFGQTYNKPPGDPAYDCRCDYNDDGSVNSSDFSFFGEHYLHSCPSSTSPLFLADIYSSAVTARITSSHSPTSDYMETRYVTIGLENLADVSVLCMGIEYDASIMTMTGWTPNREYLCTSAAVPVANNGKDIVFLAGFDMEQISGPYVELGTIEFSFKRYDLSSNVSTPESDMKLDLMFAEAVTIRGETRIISSIEYSEDTPVVVNALMNNYPNPFNPSTTIEYSISKDTHVMLSIFNVNGQLVRTLVDGQRQRNTYRVIWDGRDNSGILLSSGVYFCRISADGYIQSKKMILLR